MGYMFHGENIISRLQSRAMYAQAHWNNKLHSLRAYVSVDGQCRRDLVMRLTWTVDWYGNAKDYCVDEACMQALAHNIRRSTTVSTRNIR